MAEYISKEPMIEEMRKLIDSVAVNFPNATETELIILKGKYEAFIEYIQEQPAADVQLVVHGYWKVCKVGEMLNQCCSVCGGDCGVLYPYDFCSGVLYHYDFCPNCGAKMDLKDGDTE